MKYIAIAILAVVVLSGCEPVRNPPEADWQLAPKTHVCTVEQMDRVHTESKWCDDNTSYVSSACYGMSIMRNCSLRESAKVGIHVQ